MINLLRFINIVGTAIFFVLAVLKVAGPFIAFQSTENTEKMTICVFLFIIAGWILYYSVRRTDKDLVESNRDGDI
jgi:hypothetical protein